MFSTSSELARIATPIPWPCCGPKRSVRRISMSSVPCNRSTRVGVVVFAIGGRHSTAMVVERLGPCSAIAVAFHSDGLSLGTRRGVVRNLRDQAPRGGEVNPLTRRHGRELVTASALGRTYLADQNSAVETD